MLSMIKQVSVVGLLAMGCMAAGAAESDQITVAGSSTVRPIVEKASKEFAKLHPEVSFVVGGGGSSHGVKTVAGEEVMLGMASRDLKGSETKK